MLVSSAVPSALVCEDDRAIRSLVESILRREGFAVQTAADGHDAVLLLCEHDFDLVILDLMMPRVTGDAVIRHLEEECPELLPRVIVTTAAVNRARTMNAHAVGAIVTKPFDLREFVATIRGITGSEP